MRLICHAGIAAGLVVIAFGNFATAQISTQKVTRMLPVTLNPATAASTTKATTTPPPPAPASERSVFRSPGPVMAMPPPPPQLPTNIVAWDSETKEYTAAPGDTLATFTFNLTNVSSEEVTINSVNTSCGCTVAQLPPLPWKLAAGTNGAIPVTMTLVGKSGVIFKTVNVNSDKGARTLTVKTTIPPPPSTVVNEPMNRERNQELAKADRQAVFKGDCARCHVEPTRGKVGKELYVAACGICHEAAHRATMVADLRAIKQDTNAEFWKTWIAHGKAGSLMPAFAEADGGPLTEDQITSLVQYLITAIPSHPTVQLTNPATAAN